MTNHFGYHDIWVYTILEEVETCPRAKPCRCLDEQMTTSVAEVQMTISCPVQGNGTFILAYDSESETVPSKVTVCEVFGIYTEKCIKWLKNCRRVLLFYVINFCPHFAYMWNWTFKLREFGPTRNVYFRHTVFNNYYVELLSVACNIRWFSLTAKFPRDRTTRKASNGSKSRIKDCAGRLYFMCRLVIISILS